MLSLLGIRHHGPGSARSVIAALDEIEPDVVLIEAPSETTPALEWIGKGLEPPVALLGYVVAEPQRASFSPLAEFSPEWQAIRWANERGVPVEAIDLPLATILATSPDDEAPVLLDDDRPADPIGALAAAAGQADAERWWEDVIEHRGEGLATFAAVADAMEAVRSGSVPSQRERQREAFMRKAIRAAVKRHERVAVVCGAWHVPALDIGAPGIPNVSTDAATLRGLPRVKVAVSWVPWSHERLAMASGYAAGVRSPGWYAHLFEHPGADTVPRFFVKTAQVLRSHDLPASSDHLIAASRLTATLAALRDRPRPGLDEVLDGADAVMGGVPLVGRELVVGSKIGSVPDGAPQVPLAKDLAKRQKSARLKVTADEEVVEVDLRTPNGLRRSHLLHQLLALGVPWGAVTEGRGSSGTFRETWALVWQPEYSVRLVERAAYGTTVVRAATARLIEVAHDSTGLVELANALDRALLANLNDAIDQIVAALERRAATDPDVIALMGALGPLAQAQRYGDVRSTDRSAIAAVFDGIVVRVLAGLGAATRSVDDDAAGVIIERLSDTQHALALVDHPARRSGFNSVLEQLARPGRGNGLVQGRATRLLYDAGAWDDHHTRNRLGIALTPGTPPSVGAAFTEGFLAGSGTVLLHDAQLCAVIDGWVASLRPDAFDAVAPLLRRTFGGFGAAERRQLGRRLRGDERMIRAPYGSDLDDERVALAIDTARLMVGLAPVEAGGQR